MKIIIAGGSGLIGRELSAVLVAAGEEVTILSRHPEKLNDTSSSIRIVKWDGKSMADWVSVIEGADAVVNVVGENISGGSFIPKRWTKERKERILRSRVDAAKVLADAIGAARQKPSVYIQSSGVGYYGSDEHRIFTEKDSGADDFFANLCQQWEAASQSIEGLGVRRIIMRNGIVLSRKAVVLQLLVLPYQLFVGGRLGSGRQVYSWIHIADEVNAIQFFIHKPNTAGTYNLVSPNPMTDDEFGRTIGKLLHRPHYFHIPGFMLRLALGEVTDIVLSGQRVVPEHLLKDGFEFEFPKLEDALKDIYTGDKNNVELV